MTSFYFICLLHFTDAYLKVISRNKVTRDKVSLCKTDVFN